MGTTLYRNILPSGTEKTTTTNSFIVLEAKKNKKKSKNNTAGQGFGKQNINQKPLTQIDDDSSTTNTNYTPLQSIETTKEKESFLSFSSPSSSSTTTTTKEESIE